jgi:hypothetical protein
MSARAAVKMIVNADDFGYFDEVSRGILDCARAGVVTATGVMANGPAFERRAADLADLPALSVGVHLNATLGAPLTAQMRRRLDDTAGQFPAKTALALRVLRGHTSAAVVIDEWRAQIRRCIEAGLKLQFLNSHEHVHLLPALYAGVMGLAREFDIARVRAPRSEWGPAWSVGGIARSSVFAAVRLLLPRAPRAEPILIGLSSSGKLDLAYCRKRFPRLRGSTTYELMCHPGRADPKAIEEPKLAAYHDWELELRTLTSPEFSELLREQRITLVSYADLKDDLS